jgi:hypothetical protein
VPAAAPFLSQYWNLGDGVACETLPEMVAFLHAADLAGLDPHACFGSLSRAGVAPESCDALEAVCQPLAAAWGAAGLIGNGNPLAVACQMRSLVGRLLKVLTGQCHPAQRPDFG